MHLEAHIREKLMRDENSLRIEVESCKNKTSKLRIIDLQLN